MFEYLMNTENTMGFREFSEILTVFISIIGAYIAIKHSVFFSRDKSNKLALSMRHVFLTDAGIYIVTLIMGLGLFFHWPVIVHYDIMLRPLALILNVYASVRLYEHYQEV